MKPNERRQKPDAEGAESGPEELSPEEAQRERLEKDREVNEGGRPGEEDEPASEADATS